MKQKIVTLDNKAAGEITLNKKVFGLEIRKDILQRMVEYQRAKARQGTHKVKGVGEVKGTTAKPFRQKGTGRARQGSHYASQMRGGAVIFGPHPRDHSFGLQKKVRRLALKTALSMKASEGKLRVIDTLVTKEAKTKTLAAQFSKLGLGSALFVRGDNAKDEFFKSVQNIPHMDVIPEGGLNVLDIMKHDELVITKHALEALEERLAS